MVANTVTFEQIQNTTRNLKNAVNEAFVLIQARFKDVEKNWNDTFSTINERFQGAEKDVRDFLQKVESDGKKRFDGLKGQVRDAVNAEDLFDRVKTNDFVGQGVKIGTETFERMGFAAASDVSALGGRVDKLSSRIETLRRRISGHASSHASSKELEALVARIALLEASVSALSAASTRTAPVAAVPAAKPSKTRKTAASKKSNGRGATTRKATASAKKAPAKKTPARRSATRRAATKKKS